MELLLALRVLPEQSSRQVAAASQAVAPGLSEWPSEAQDTAAAGSPAWKPALSCPLHCAA